MKGFGSDNHSGIHPSILKSIIDANIDHAPSYGTDELSAEAIRIFKTHFGPQIDVHFVYNGTAANVLSLRAGMKNYQSVICADQSHLNIDEGAAPEFFAGKLIPVLSENGKIKIDEVEKQIIRKGDQHFSQVKMISLTQPTEVGTCYSLDEIKTIVQLAKKHNLYVHIDGARLSNACVNLNTNFKQMTTDLGIDIVSFGGTKNGFAFGEAVIIINPDLQKDFKYLRKQSAQLPSKTRFIACQFKAYLENNLFLEIARHEIQMAQLLENELRTLNRTDITISYPVNSNAVFVKIPKHLIKTLREHYFFYIWNEQTFECRLMTSWDTHKDDITGFIDLLRS